MQIAENKQHLLLPIKFDTLHSLSLRQVFSSFLKYDLNLSINFNIIVIWPVSTVLATRKKTMAMLSEAPLFHLWSVTFCSYIRDIL